MRTIFSLILALSLLGCSRTGYLNVSGWPSYLNQDDFVMSRIAGTNFNESEMLFKKASIELKTLKNKVLYLPEQEYELVSQGIGQKSLKEEVLTTDTKRAIAKILDVEYLLKVEVFKLQGGDTYGHTTELERQQPTFTEEEQRKATLIFSIIGLKENLRDYKFQVTSVINPWTFSGKNDNEHDINLATKEKALRLAFKKGLKRIRRGMVENN